VYRYSLFFLVTTSLFAAGTETLSPVEVSTPKDHPSIKTSEVPLTKVSSDTASLLSETPGVSLQTGGGLSSLPVMHGMADDRVNIKIDGATITSSCSNHMNPTLSYIDPSKIQLIDVLPGITPVSYGGDSIAGSIIVKTKTPLFALTPEDIRQKLNVSTYYKSNNENFGGTLNFEIASKKLFFSYAGLDESAHNYRDGSGERIKATLYNQNNQSATIGRKVGDGVLSLKLTRAGVPYQGFINQRMDLRDNVSNQARANYQGMIGEALIESTFFYQHTNHYMDILSSERPNGMKMPMHTRADEAGYNVKASFDMNKNNFLSVGSDFNQYHLDDWWTGLDGVTSIMGPGNFQSINDGKRQRLGLFVEADSQWSSSFSTNLGLRTDIVTMNAEDVHGYNETDNLPGDAAFFNSQSHKKNDHNYDATILSKIKMSPGKDLELGLARKTRSPNLYERYAWAGLVTDPTNIADLSSQSASMDMLMINWFGDGNGYVGDINLKPEVAHKISASLIAYDEIYNIWEIRLTPYFSDIKNFIDADFIGHSEGNNFLKFANHDAVIFGADFSARIRILRHRSLGEFNLKTIAAYNRGYRKDGKADLYHLMPLNGKIILEHLQGKWSSNLITHLVAEKEQVNELRLEPATGRYALLDLGTSYQMSKLTKIDLSVNNVFDLRYGLPLGGVDLVNHPPASRTSVVGMGRSINAAVSIDIF
jgi:iron complex outermembrane receptor protein